MHYIAPMLVATYDTLAIVRHRGQKIGLAHDNLQPSSTTAYEADE